MDGAGQPSHDSATDRTRSGPPCTSSGRPEATSQQAEGDHPVTDDAQSARRSLVVTASRLVLLVMVSLALPSIALASPAPGTVQTFTYGSGDTAHQYLVYTPTSYKPGRRLPLLVMLHGCETTAYEQMEANLYNPLADQKGFVVVYPDTDAIENDVQQGPTQRCWQFPDPQDWERGQGDGAVVAAITQSVMAGWNIDPQRVYVMGMSAGSFLSADLAAEYPDLYAASGENAGGAYADGTCLFTSTASMPVQTSAQLAFAQMGPRARVVPRIVIGGDADQGVPPACADKALLQGLRTDNLVIDGTQTAPISLTPATVTHGQVTGGYSYTVSDYFDGHGCVVGQRILVHGMNHFWSGGSSDPKWHYFTDPKGPSAAIASWNFFSGFTLANTAHPCSPMRTPGRSPADNLPGGRGCPAAHGHLDGMTLGPVSLGMTRARARRAFVRSTTRGRRYMDFFCLTPTGIRAGYPSPKLLNTLPDARATTLRDRVVLLLTANRFYALRGIRPATPLKVAARRIRLTGPFRIGLNDWYLLPNGPSRGVLKVRHGTIEEIGIATRRLTANRHLTSDFFRSFD